MKEEERESSETLRFATRETGKGSKEVQWAKEKAAWGLGLGLGLGLG